VFRSLLIPLVAAVMKPAVRRRRPRRDERGLQLGLGSKFLHLSGTGPVDAFLPVLIFSVLFGLSMDLRGIPGQPHPGGMAPRQELHGRQAQPPGSHHRQAKSGPVIAAAAGIMILVFGSFMFGARELAEFGFGLGFSVLVDALLIRSLLVPALMHLIGPANWALARVARPHPAPASRRGRGNRPPASLGSGVIAGPGNLAGPGHTAPNLWPAERQHHE